MTLAINPFYSYIPNQDRVEVVYTPLNLTLYSFAYVPDPYYFSKIFLHLKVSPQGKPDLYLKTGSVAKRLGLTWSDRPADQHQFEGLLLERSLDTIINQAGLTDFYNQTRAVYAISKEKFIKLHGFYCRAKAVAQREEMEVVNLTEKIFLGTMQKTVIRVRNACIVQGKFLARGAVKIMNVGLDFGQKKLFAILNCDLKNPDLKGFALNDLKKLLALQNIPVVAKVVGSLQFPDKLMIIMPFYRPGNLLDFVRKVPLSFCDRFILMRQMGEIIEKIHKRGFVHNDVKLENFLLDEEGRLHITDFGFSSTIDEQIYLNAGSTIEGSPEARNNQPIHYSRDVWSLGITYLTLLMCRTPEFEVFDDGSFDYTQVLLPDPNYFTEQGNQDGASLLNLISFMLQKNPAHRPPIQDVNDFLRSLAQ